MLYSLQSSVRCAFLRSPGLKALLHLSPVFSTLLKCEKQSKFSCAMFKMKDMHCYLSIQFCLTHL